MTSAVQGKKVGAQGKAKVQKSSEYNEVIDHLVSLENLDFKTKLNDSSSSELKQIVAQLQEKLSFILGDFAINATNAVETTKNLTGNAREVLDSAKRVADANDEVAASAAQMSSNMNSVSAIAEEFSVNMQSISENAKGSKENINTVATATRELTDASREIAQHTEKAKSISEKAVDEVKETEGLVENLGIAAGEISEVTNTISEISDQTKLLALNATIEAARAGEAGLGFAVVAGEVKQLASQTNTATKNIKGKIEIIQSATQSTIKAIKNISEVIREVSEIVGIIAAAAEEQSATTQDISKNIEDTTARIEGVTTAVSEGALAIQEVNENISNTATIAEELSSSVEQIRKGNGNVKDGVVVLYANALEVESQATDIKSQMKEFILPDNINEDVRSTKGELCRFNKSFDVLVEKMNDEHKKIFAYINSIHEGVKQRKTQQDLIPMFKELADYTTFHFAEEEKFMASISYPDLPRQKSQHTALLTKVGDILKQLTDNEEVDLIQVMVFLKRWLIDHIQAEDIRYGEFNRSNQTN